MPLAEEQRRNSFSPRIRDSERPAAFYPDQVHFGGPGSSTNCLNPIHFVMPKFEKHIFICGNQRPAGAPRPCCDPAGQAELQKSFKEKLAARGLKGRVRANQSGCLDQCEHGPNLVVYPDAVWYGRVTLDDVDEIIESHIVGGKPVERLMLPDSCLNTTCEHRMPKAATKV